MIKKNLEYYLGLPYKVVLYPAEEGGYAIEIPELPGCISQGQTLKEAYKMIQEAKQGWLELALQDGKAIPEPTGKEEYSGKFNIRMPKSLHRTLVAKAKDENVSLNQYINYQLARSVGHATAGKARHSSRSPNRGD